MATIKEMNAQLQLLDTWTQLSVLSSWSFMVNAACINQAMRYIPDAPVDNGIEQFTVYEAARRALRKDCENGNMPALVELQRDVVGSIFDADGQARGLEDTLEYMVGTAPKEAEFKAEYEMRRRQGMKPAMPLRVFVQYEMERAMNQYNLLVAKGEDAVRLVDTFTPPTDDSEHETKNELPDWITESFERKLIDKLNTRWEKLEFVRTNPRRRKSERDSAKADQMMIAKVLAEYGEEPGFADMDDEDEPESSARPLNEPTAASKADVKAPGPVTVYRPSGTPAQINHRT